MATIKLKAGDDIPLEFTITDGGEAVDLTGGTLTFKIAKSILDSNEDAVYFDTFTTFTDAADGIHVEVIPKETTALWQPNTYYCQGRFTDSDGKVRSEKIEPCLIEKIL